MILNDLEKQFGKLKKQLEEETLLRVDLENKNQTLKEDLQFKSTLYDKVLHYSTFYKEICELKFKQNIFFKGSRPIEIS